MFNLNRFKLVKELKNKDIKNVLSEYALSRNKGVENVLLKEIISDNKFVQQELKIRKMVEKMLEEEFSPEIKKLKSYNFLVDSVVDKLKQNQLKDTDSIESQTK